MNNYSINTKILFIILLVFSGINLIAQGRVSSSAEIRITIVQGISITPVSGDLNFGEYALSGSDNTMNKQPDEGRIYLVEGQPERNVTINYQNTILTPVSSSQDLTSIENLIFTPAVQVKNQNNIQEIKSGDSIMLENIGNRGLLEVAIGGSVLVKKNQPTGDYSGIFTITVEY